ncbi:MAG: non-ribosomal peptide synthetase [Verrucomicrobiae bacterium]
MRADVHPLHCNQSLGLLSKAQGGTAGIAGLFSRRALEFPQREAVVWDGGALTYGELEERSNRVARHLISQGAGSLVGIAIERSAEMVIGLLGILKSGAAYVPLDLSQPQGRNELFLRETGAGCVLASKGGPAVDLPGTKVVFLEDAESGTNPGRETGGESLCYVLFTSGSTGKPKAVGVPHRAVLRLVHGADFADMAGTWLHMAPLAFDASTLEIWAPLCNGGRLALMPPGPHSLRDIGEAIRRHGVTSAWLTAGLFRVMVDEHIEGLAPLSQLLTGGDVVPAAQAGAVLTRHPGLRLINGYGPTENTTFTCCHRITPEDCVSGTIPVGRAISGTTVRILSESLESCPRGVAGELCAGGEGLALGYLNQPEQTADKFFIHPEFGRLYRTGDLCRMRGDGVVEFLGRMDNQIKIRGFRVEPGEIECVLAAFPGIRQAAVVATGSAEVRLAACVVPASFDEAGLRGFLQTRLPAHMVPSVFLGFEALPLNANGKVDRAALGAKVAPSSATGPRHLVPEGGALEARVRAVWEDILGREGLGRDAGFFECGGDSILLARLHSRLGGLTDGPLPITDLFEHSTIRSQVVLLAGGLNDGAKAAIRDRASKQRAALAGRRAARL